MKRSFLQTLVILGICVPGILCFSLSTTQLRASDEVKFNRDIRPILSAKCFKCHGPDSKKRKEDLRFDIEAGVKEAFPAGDLKKGEAWLRINSDDKDERMPQVKSGLKLKPAEIALIKRWIEQGAEFQSHWSFVPAKIPPIPPEMSDPWVRNKIDAFILKRLRAEGLNPNAEADRERLLRRVTFDLTGLPPTISQIDDFLADKSDAAYKKVVDRLLSSESFGERMAVAWMDVARYGDTSVFHADGPRDMWAWRDWVIRAYNDNKPFDQFTIEQLAGDLLPKATIEQQIASGFNRNNATTDEGGAIAEEYRIEYALDRVKTTSMVWMGLTMECGQCHEHKYDPISQEEYYKFFAYFNQASDPGMQSRKKNQAPIVNVPDFKQHAAQATIRAEIRRLQADLDARKSKPGPEFDKWLAKLESAGQKKVAAPADMLLHYTLDEGKGSEVKDSVDPKRKGRIKGKPKWPAGKIGRAIRTDRRTFVDLGDVANFERTDKFSYGAWLKPSGDGAPIARMNDKNSYRGYDLLLQNGGSVAVHIIHKWPDNAIKVGTKKKLAKNKWQHVFVTYDGSSKATGVKIYVNGEPWDWTIESDSLSESVRAKVPLKLGRRSPGSPYTGQIDDVRFYARELAQAEVNALAGQDPIGPILAKKRADRTEKEVGTLRSFFLSNHDALYKRINKELALLKSKESKSNKTISTVMVMKDVAKPRMTYVLERGNYALPKKDKPMQPGVPSILPPLPKGAPPNRLGLAKWLVQSNQPLTPRVTVNRYWQMLFGVGLVKTAEDFGSQGEWPSHPKLLDYLAVDFVESGWDIKRMIKQMVMSAAYRQSSRLTPKLYERDPDNRLLARGPRFRLQGEFIRDNALAASGLLVGTIGGPSVKPYQPPGLWNEVSINTGLRFKQDKGEKLYRRSLYIYWKRSAPPPTMVIFDAPSREKCTIRRSRTNTPLQALVTLNDPQFVEAARALAERVMTGGGTIEEKITKAYRLVAGVRPKSQVLAILSGAYKEELSVFKNYPARATQLLKIGESKRNENLSAAEQAAMTIVMSMILNLDETLTRG